MPSRPATAGTATPTDQKPARINAPTASIRQVRMAPPFPNVSIRDRTEWIPPASAAARSVSRASATSCLRNSRPTRSPLPPSSCRQPDQARPQLPSGPGATAPDARAAAKVLADPPALITASFAKAWSERSTVRPPRRANGPANGTKVPCAHLGRSATYSKGPRLFGPGGPPLPVERQPRTPAVGLAPEMTASRRSGA